MSTQSLKTKAKKLSVLEFRAALKMSLDKSVTSVDRLKTWLSAFFTLPLTFFSFSLSGVQRLMLFRKQLEEEPKIPLKISDPWKKEKEGSAWFVFLKARGRTIFLRLLQE